MVDLLSRIMSLGFKETLEKSNICFDFIECVRKLVKQGKGLREAIRESDMEIINKHGLPLDYDVYDDCEAFLYEIFGIDLEEKLKEKGGK